MSGVGGQIFSLFSAPPEMKLLGKNKSTWFLDPKNVVDKAMSSLRQPAPSASAGGPVAAVAKSLPDSGGKAINIRTSGLGADEEENSVLRLAATKAKLGA